MLDKTGLQDFLKCLDSFNYTFLASGNTEKTISAYDIHVKSIASYTGVNEMLGGRVKTLHPAVHAGILARNNCQDEQELKNHNFKNIDFVICNLYPFSEVTKNEDVDFQVAIENIDIGGVTLLRAGAKNFEKVTVVCDPMDYSKLIKELECNKGTTSLETRQRLALKAFTSTANYDEKISDFLRKRSNNITPIPGHTFQMNLRYGMNPSQKPAQIFNSNGPLPFSVLCGAPGYINLLDALNSWQLVKELRNSLGYPAAASFKHVSPAGVGVGIPFNTTEARVFMVEDLLEQLTPVAISYARARGSDRMSSYGDFIALSDTCDHVTAKIISREVSDGIIAPGYTAEALQILSRKKNGSYCILKMDAEYEPPLMERKMLYGLTLEQPRNLTKINPQFFSNVVSKTSKLPDSALRDLIIASIALKYTQSNSVCYAKDGQTIGIGAGQQSRIHCTRLAGEKVNNWWLRHNPKVLTLQFKGDIKRAQKINTIDAFINFDGSKDYMAKESWVNTLQEIPEPLTKIEKEEWIQTLKGVSLSSDAFFPFRDSVDRAVQSGVQYVASPAGSTNDELVIEAANEYGITLIFTPERLFHH